MMGFIVTDEVAALTGKSANSVLQGPGRGVCRGRIKQDSGGIGEVGLYIKAD